MCKVKDEFAVGNYRILGLDEPLPTRPFRFLIIDGRAYSALNAYDVRDAIGIYDDGISLVSEGVGFSL